MSLPREDGCFCSWPEGMQNVQQLLEMSTWMSLGRNWQKLYTNAELKNRAVIYDFFCTAQALCCGPCYRVMDNFGSFCTVRLMV